MTDRDDIFDRASRSDHGSASDKIRVVVLAGFGPGDRWTVPDLAERIGSRADAEYIVTDLIGYGAIDRVHVRGQEDRVEWRFTSNAIRDADGIRLPEDGDQ